MNPQAWQQPAAAPAARSRSASGEAEQRPGSMAEGFKQFLMSHRGFSLVEAEAMCRELESRMQPVSSGTDFQSLLESFVQTQKTLTASLTEAVRGVDGEDISKFREPNMSSPSNMICGTFEVRDNSTDTFCWRMRLSLLAPNAAPASYWHNIPDGAKVTAPKRAGSLYLSHIAGNSAVNPIAVLAAHDRSSPLIYQMFLTKNSDIRGKCAKEKSML